jgi:predicted permease
MATLLATLRSLVRRGTLDHELNEEMRLHLELETEDLVRLGVPRAEAERRARIAFGGVERFKDAQRDLRASRWLEELWQDLRYAARALRRAPLFSLSAILVLALGIGAVTAAFSAIDSVMLTRLPYPGDDRLLRIYLQYGNGNRFGLSTVEYRAIEAQQHSFTAVGMLRPREAPVAAGGIPARARIGWATAGFFQTLGVAPLAGRLTTPADDSVGAPRVALLSHGYATRVFGEAARALGQAVTIDGTSFSVIGVLPSTVTDLAGVRADLWPSLQLPPPTRRGPFGQMVIARMRDTATLESAAADLATISRQIFPAWAASFQDTSATLTPFTLRRAMIGDTGRTLGLFGAAAALVLLVAIANVASLMLARTIGRWREVTVRRVLGASRVRLIRLLATESLLLALLGALGGIALAGSGIRVIAFLSGNPVGMQQAGLNGTVLAFAIGTALISALVIGAYPVLLLVRGNAAAAMRDGDRSSSGGVRTGRLRGVLVSAEFALTLPLLVGAGLLLNSATRLQRVELGFESSHLLTLRTALPLARYSADSLTAGFWRRALDEVRAIPGVVDAGLSTSIPPEGAWDFNNFDLVDHPVAPGSPQPVSPWSLSDREYFRALGIPLVDGRFFLPTDTGPAPVVLVSQSWARHYFPDGSPVGRQLISGGCNTCPLTTVVGVVGDVKLQGLGESADAVYSPLSEGWSTGIYLFVRTASAPQQLVAPVQAKLQSLDAEVPVDDILPMDQRMAAATARARQWPMLLGGFAGIALVLAAIGVFGMLSYGVQARRREIGVRMALGAEAGEVTGEIVRKGMGHALAGAAAGLVLAIGGGRWLAGALYDVSPTDPLTLSAVTLLLLAVALIACWLPARKAAAVAPGEALRSDT